jgi:hypothetical protein
MPRYKPRIQAGPKLSHDAPDKLMACLLWWVAESKTHPDYVRAPFYFDAILKWHASLSLDGNELCATVHEVYTNLRYGGKPVALKYAEDLPAVPPWPFT